MKNATWTNTFVKTGGTSDDVREKGTLIIVLWDGEKEGSKDKHLDVQDQGTLKAKLVQSMIDEPIYHWQNLILYRLLMLPHFQYYQIPMVQISALHRKHLNQLLKKK